MSEFFLELFSEEIPPKLQKDAKSKIKYLLEENLNKKMIGFKSSKSFSTPKRLVFVIDGIPKKIQQKSKIIKGPRIDAPQVALEGFLKSNQLNKSDIYEKEIEKGKFYFANTKLKMIDVFEEFKLIIPEVLKNYSWKKAMRWSDYNLNWGRPLRSIVSLFDKKTVYFEFFHLASSNRALIEENLETKTKIITDFKSYLHLMKSKNIILDEVQRKKIIENKFNQICKSKELQNTFNTSLLEEVVNLVENPNVIIGKFDQNFLKIPKEILIVTMQKHQKYFPLFDKENQLTNLFLIVTNLKDEKGYIKIGNQRVIKARLSDAQFFWEKNKAQNLVKQISKLKSLSFFNKLGSMYNKTQRLRKLSSLISEQLNLNKEKAEIAASICKSDLVSDLVGEYPELQGILGKYFSQEQGFDNEISIAISDHYLPTGLNSTLPKKPISCTIAIADKIDNLVGFFGLNEKPTSSKDPYALRRAAIGLLKIIIENRLIVQLKDLINYSIILYEEQGVKFLNDSTLDEIMSFLKERIINLLKDKKIRNDIIEAAISSHSGDNFISLYDKSFIMNKNISKDVGKKIISTYKRASNILDQEIKNYKEKILGQPDSILFKKDEEKFLFDKINEIRKYFATMGKKEQFQETLRILADAKIITDNFFDNVIVNDENQSIKKNRLELLQMFCNTYENFIDFSKMEGA